MWIVQVHAHIPLPATRLALHNICETAMRQAAALIARLNKQWGAYRRKHHYNRPHLFLDKDASYFHSGPLVQRPLKLKLARDAVDRWMLTLVLYDPHILHPYPASLRFLTPPPHCKTRLMHLSLTSDARRTETRWRTRTTCLASWGATSTPKYEERTTTGGLRSTQPWAPPSEPHPV